MGLKKFFHKLEKQVRPIVKPVLPVAGSLIGGLFGGPLGAISGGAIAGALSSKSHRLDHALGGAGIGLGNAFLGPKIGHLFGVNPEGTMGGMLNMGHPGIAEQVQGLLGPAAFMGQKAPGGQQEPPPGGGPPPPPETSFLSSLGPKGLMDAALFGTAIAGKLGARSKVPHEPSIEEIMQARQHKWKPEDLPRQTKPMQRRYIQPSPGYVAGLEPEHVYYENVNPTGYKKGGYVDGYSGGQTDDRPTKIPEGSYVMDATTVSLYGDGNSRNGAKKLHKDLHKFTKSGITEDYMPSNVRYIDAKVSDGEYIVDRNIVRKIGDGDVDKGGKVLDKFRNKIRKQKGVNKFLPPKSKQFNHYVR